MYSKRNYQGSQSSYPSEPISFTHFNMRHPVNCNNRPCLFGMNIFRHPRLSSLFVTIIFKPILLFLLSIKRWPLNKNLSELFVLMHDMYLTSQFMKLLRKQYRPKGQLISKAKCQAVDSTKKRTNEFAFFDLKSCYVVKSNTICSFFWRI